MALPVVGCAGRQRTPSAGPVLLPLTEQRCRAVLQESLCDPDSLRSAAARSLAYLERMPERRTFRLVDRTITATGLRRTLTHLLASIRSAGPDGWQARFCRHATLLRLSTPSPLLVTGYYQPVLRARRARNASFRYPLYAPPADPTRYSRAQIDAGAISGLAGVIAWLDDPVDAFFLHVQGSGLLELEDGQRLQVGYAGSNGRPYRSIGRWLVDTGRMKRGTVTMQSLEAYLRTHPQELSSILQVNERYIFFRILEQGPVGSLNVPLTAHRSVAADPAFFAPGAPAFLRIEGLPPDANAGCPPGIVFVQDAGNAITGPARLDLYTGTGERAGQIAGAMHHRGELYLLLSDAPTD